MKKILLTAIAVAILAFAAFAQSKDEKEVLKFLADYDAAYLTKDISVPERIWAKNYLVSTICQVLMPRLPGRIQHR